MKKLLAVLLSAAIVTSISAPVLALGTKQEATYYENTKRCVVRGYLAESEKQFKEVSISLVDGDGNLVYADSTDIDNWGFYEFNFEYAGDMNALTMNLRRDGEIITDYSDITALAYSGAVTPEFKIIEAEDGGKAYTAEVVLENQYGLNDKYLVIFAFYDENNGLVGTKTFEDNAFDTVQSTTYFSVNVPTETKNVKAFIWRDLTSLMPLANAVQSENLIQLEPGTRLAWVGDSLQAGVNSKIPASAYVEYILKLRYPTKDIQFDNRAIAGDAPTSASVGRLVYDSFALYDMFGSDEAFEQACEAQGYVASSLTPNQALHMSLIAAFGSDTLLNAALSQKGYAIATLTTEQIDELIDLAGNADVSVNTRGETLSLLAGKSPNHLLVTWGVNSLDYFNRLKEETLTARGKELAEQAFENYKMYISEVFKYPSIDRITIVSCASSRQHPDPDRGLRPGGMYAIDYLNMLTKEFVENAAETGKYTVNGAEVTIPEGKTLDYIDVWKDIYDLYRETPDISFNMFADDTHMNTQGHIFWATKTLKGFGVSPYVAYVEADAQGNNIKAINAAVTNFANTDGVITYTYAPKAFPVAVNEHYTLTKENVYDLSEDINLETIKLSGLENASYVLTLDGTEVGTYTKEELERGINIAELEQNPNQKISQEIFENYFAIGSVQINTRRIYANMGGMNGNQGDLLDGIKKLTSVSSNPFDYYDVMETIYNSRQAAKAYTTPESYEVVLTPVID